MQVPVGGGQKRTGWSLRLHTGLSAPRSKGAVGWRPCCEGLETVPCRNEVGTNMFVTTTIPAWGGQGWLDDSVGLVWNLEA